MNKYKLELEKFLKENEVKCINEDCKCTDMGIDNWGTFEGEKDWFYYCRECDDTFNLEIARCNSVKR
jgi:hypothetical protein